MTTFVCIAVNPRRSFAVAAAEQGDVGLYLFMRTGFDEWVAIARFHDKQSADEFAELLNPPSVRQEK